MTSTRLRHTIFGCVPQTILCLWAWLAVLGWSPAYPQAAKLLPQQSTDFAAAQQLFADHQYLQAAELFANAAKHAQESNLPEQAAALHMQAKCYVNLSRFPEADAALRAALRSQPGSAESLYLLGFVLQRENQPAASLGIFTQAAAISPPQSDDLKAVALDYILLNDYPDAVHWLQQALALNPRNAEGWYDLGRAQMHLSHFTQAVQAFQRSLAITPNNARALANLGLSYEAQDKPEEALKAYQAGVEIAQQSPQPPSEPFLDLGTYLEQHKEYVQAEPMLLRATQLAPNSGRCFEELARAYLGEEKAIPARTAMEHAIALDGKNPRLHFQLARIYRKLGLVEQSKTEFAETARLYGTHSVSIDPE